ncbi:hypothetical protein BDV10DRAFT_29682 [Aspergillus recurvatus]
MNVKLSILDASPTCRILDSQLNMDDVWSSCLTELLCNWPIPAFQPSDRSTGSRQHQDRRYHKISRPGPAYNRLSARTRRIYHLARGIAPRRRNVSSAYEPPKEPLLLSTFLGTSGSLCIMRYVMYPISIQCGTSSLGPNRACIGRPIDYSRHVIHNPNPFPNGRGVRSNPKLTSPGVVVGGRPLGAQIYIRRVARQPTGLRKHTRSVP